MKKKRNKDPIQPVSGTKVPRFAGPSTFARLPELRDVESCDIAIVGIPFDAGTSYRPGARFGPQSIRQASRHLRTNYHPSYDVEPFKVQQVADAGDITCNPFNIEEAIKQIEVGAEELLNKVGGIISLGGDHTIAFPLLKAVNKINNGPVALVHFDAHLDTWDTYFGAPYTHGTPFRRAREENLFLDDASMHVGIRGPLYSRDDIKNDESFGFKIIHCDEFQTQGTDKIAERIKKRVGDNPLYLSIDIDVLDPALVDPVKEIILISGWLVSASPVVAPSPLTKLNTPAGNLVSSINSASIIDDNGASSDGFKTIVHPEAIAGITFKQTWFIGQFQGVINAQTPFGS